MDNKFETELDKIEKLLNKVDIDLNTDFTKVDFSTFFKNVDKTFEIYNICLEELCGQLYLLELPMHSKVYRKLYHHYKHQLYNIMKFQLNMQKELNERADEEKNNKLKIESLSSKLKNVQDKKKRLQLQIEEQKQKIDRLVLFGENNSKKNEQNNQSQIYNNQEQQQKSSQLTNENDSKVIETSQVINKGRNGKRHSSRLQEIVQQKKMSLLQQTRQRNTERIAQLEQIFSTNQDVDEIHEQIKEEYKEVLIETEGFVQQIEQLRMTIRAKTMLTKSSFQLSDKITQTEQEFVTLEEHNVLFQNMERLKADQYDQDQQYNSTINNMNDHISELIRQNKEYQEMSTNSNYARKITEEELHHRDQLLIEREAEISKLFVEVSQIREQRDDLVRNTTILEQQNHQLMELNKTFEEELKRLENGEGLSEDQYNNYISSLKNANRKLEERIEELELLLMQKAGNIDEGVQQLIIEKGKRVDKLEKEVQEMIREGIVKSKEMATVDDQYNKLKETYLEQQRNLKEAQSQLQIVKTQIQKSKINAKSNVVKTDLKNKSQKNQKGRNTNIIENKSNVIQSKVKKQIIIQTQNENQTQTKKKEVSNKGKQIQNTSKENEQQIKMFNNEAQGVKNIKKSTQVNTQKQMTQTQNSVQETNELTSQKNLPNQKGSKQNIGSSQIMKQNSTQSISKIQDRQKEQSQDKFQIANQEKEHNDDQDDRNIFEEENSEDYEDDYQTDDQDQNEEEEDQKQSFDQSMANINNDILDELENMEAQAANHVDMIENSQQTDYMSIAQYIIDNEEDIRFNETDFEKIKVACDILSELIGFDNIEDYNEIQPTVTQSHEPPSEKPQSISNDLRTSKYQSKIKNSTLPAKKEKKKLKEPQKIQKIKKIDNKLKKPEKETASNLEDQIQQSMQKQNDVIIERQKKQKPKRNVVTMKVEKDIPIECEFIDEDDQLIKKSKIMRNTTNRNEAIEVIEFIRVPKELNIQKQDERPQEEKLYTEKDQEEYFRITNYPMVDLDHKLREKERLIFRVYINIKKRYSKNPEKFLNIYKLTFNRIPDFAQRMDENYDSKAFLFNFEEFKEHFMEIVHGHQTCGKSCIHFHRFYKKMGIIQENKLNQDENPNQEKFESQLPNLLENHA